MEATKLHYFCKHTFMKNFPLYFLLIALLSISLSCSKKKYTTKVVKPRYHHRWYDPHLDRNTSRTKRIKVQN
ncbi:hypothetical protein DQQ10_09690 [Pseudochryseolinea flava]|uniref:Uncharacterized protein n=1 Tax=Pseudochryseolinea flava TaxID=2059302 RepID=A0A364Y4Q9_9BACT|nr:hypothetical protein DQQ10_09690 [Pseudochryseolinea flava]